MNVRNVALMLYLAIGSLLVSSCGGTTPETLSHSGGNSPLDANHPPVFDTSVPPPPAGQAGVAYFYPASATDGDGDALTFELVVGPGGMTVSAAGLITWTPGSGDIGVHNVTLQVGDGAATALLDWSIQIAAASANPPVIATLPDPPPSAATVNQPYSVQISDLVTPLPDITVGASVNGVPGFPSWLNLAGVHGTVILSGIPAQADAGTVVDLTVIASNGPSSTASLQFSITVQNSPVAGTAPVITSSPPGGALAGQLWSYTVQATGIPAPTINAAATVAGAPAAWLTFDSNSSTLSGTPSAADAGTSVDVAITADNGVAPAASQQFSITVQNSPVAGIAPVITSSPPGGALAGQLWSYTVQATGIPAPTINAAATVAGAPAAWLTFDSNSSTLSGTPSAADAGTSVDVAITADNGVAPAASQQFSVSVLGVAPLILSTPPGDGSIGISYLYTIHAEGYPIPAVSVTAAVAGSPGLPAWLKFSPGSNNLFGTPQPVDLNTVVDIVVTADNGIQPTASQQFSITVQQSWNMQILDIDGSTGLYNRLVIDGSGWSHIVCKRTTDGGAVRYVTNVGGTWVSTTVASNIGSAGSAAIAVESSGRVHIVYCSGPTGASEGPLKYMRSVLGQPGQQWEELTVAPLARGMPSLMVDGSGVVHIAYYNTGNGVMYARGESLSPVGLPSWTVETVAQNQKSPSLGLGSGGTVHMVYGKPTGGGISGDGLWYVRRLTAGWSIPQLIDSAGENNFGEKPLAVDSTGAIHVGYRNGNTGALWYARSPQGQVWDTQHVTNSVQGYSIALDGNDGLHVAAYQSYGMNLLYATNAAGAWNIEVVDEAGNVGNYPSLALDGMGMPHIAYYTASPYYDTKYAKRN